MPITPFKPLNSITPGARVALVAPAGALRDEQDLERAIANTKSLGWDPVVGENALKRHTYFAGNDTERLHDLNKAITDKNIDAIWCIRGGYGAIRLLGEIDYDAFARGPKPIIGFSDITALLIALGRSSNTITYHGPTARGNLTHFSKQSLVKAVTKLEDSCGSAPQAEVLSQGDGQTSVEGRLDGGNLALLAALCGTSYQPSFKDSVVVLEDINEQVYRIDRLLQQLVLSGAFAGCKALIFGNCASCTGDSGRTLNDVLREVAGYLKVPCISGVPVGHIDDQWTLPIGARCDLDVNSKTLTVIR